MKRLMLVLALLSCVSCSAISARRAVFRADLSRLISRYRERILPTLEGEDRIRDAATLAEVEALMELTSLIPIKDE